MRRILLVVGLVAMFGAAATPAARASVVTAVAPSAATVGKLSPCPPSGIVGAEIPNPGLKENDVLVCVYPTAGDGVDVLLILQAAPGSAYGYNWVNFGTGAGVCHRTSPAAYTCVGGGTAGIVRVDPYNDGGLYFGGTSVCHSTDTSYYGECVFTLNALFVDGASGDTMGVGTAQAVCVQGNTGGLICTNSLGIPAGTSVDLTPQRDLVFRVVKMVCDTGICDVAQA